MAAVFAFDPGKTVVQIATVEVPVNDLFQIRPPETVLSRFGLFSLDLLQNNDILAEKAGNSVGKMGLRLQVLSGSARQKRHRKG